MLTMPMLRQIGSAMKKEGPSHPRHSKPRVGLTIFMLILSASCVNWAASRQRQEATTPARGVGPASEPLTTAKVVIYTKKYCPYCIQAKAFLSKKGLAFEERDVEHDLSQRKLMIERSQGRRTVPQIFVGDTHVGGLDDMEKLEAQGKFDALLKK